MTEDDGEQTLDDSYQHDDPLNITLDGAAYLRILATAGVFVGMADT